MHGDTLCGKISSRKLLVIAIDAQFGHRSHDRRLQSRLVKVSVQFRLCQAFSNRNDQLLLRMEDGGSCLQLGDICNYNLLTVLNCERSK